MGLTHQFCSQAEFGLLRCSNVLLIVMLIFMVVVTTALAFSAGFVTSVNDFYDDQDILAELRWVEFVSAVDANV